MNTERHEILSTQKWKMPARLSRPDFLRGYDAHWHGQIEFLFITSGSLTAIVSNELITVCEGDLIIVNENEVHLFKPTDAECLCLHISEGFLDSMSLPDICFRHILCGNKKVRALFDSMAQQLKNPELYSGFFIMSRVYELFACLISSATAYRLSPKKLARSANSEKSFKSVIAQIETHFSEELTTEALAKSVFFSEAYFCRYFKQRTGETPIQYIKRFRIKKAQSLLAHTENSITEIAFAVGFSNSNYFSRVFRSITGVSPAEYRQAHS